jgi:SAM-dependent methyltransferase
LIIFDLPEVWWGRHYEYEWARQFCAKEDVALDAACGICHPFKFYLADNCKEAYCCDWDPRILSKSEILLEITETFGVDAVRNFPAKYFTNILYQRASLLDLPYQDKYFDKIYCISVLEHLDDDLNPFLIPAIDFSTLPKTIKHEIHQAMKEFKRVLKDDGFMILTFDYPSINLQYLSNIIANLNLVFAGNTKYALPDNAIYSQLWNLYCFKAVIRKPGLRRA